MKKMSILFPKYNNCLMHFFLAVTGTGSVNVDGEKMINLFTTDRYTIKKLSLLYNHFTI